MATHGSLLKALRIMDNNNHQRSDRTSSQSNWPSMTSIELDLKFKMARENSGPLPAPTSTSAVRTDEEECRSSPPIGVEQKGDEKDGIIQRKLSMRAYHLPGNTWRQDLGMYIMNNHLIIGICCHHRLHPVKMKQRLVIMLGSLAFGLSATNAVYLYYLWGSNADYDGTALSISLGGEVVENVTVNALTLNISHGMTLLWTVGASAHSFFDLALWHMLACGCVKQKYCKVAGWNMAVAIVVLLVALTSFMVVVRAYEPGEEDEHYVPNPSIEHTSGFTEADADFQYLYGYLVELVLSLFVYTPLVQILLFTGILGCGAVPFLGGRPYEVRKCKT